MGNQLVGIAPSQIYPVERYLSGHPELKFDLSLGSTRFLKVARAECQEGLIVVKVFAIHDPSLPLATYKDHLEDIRQKLSSAVNCIPYQRILLTDTAGLIMREFVKYTLYDRISTRPFLTTIEKKWITFQILYALHQCHRVGVCHGDIKLENITVTSWNWVLLVDFASFKPTFLPEDNPSDYSYFFDTSRRRTCYIAPERFTRTTHVAASEHSALITEATCDSGSLTPAMDIFSAGCALLELWNELHVPFEYSQLLAYREGIYLPQKHLDKLEDPNLRNLISSMIDKDPSKRKTAEDYLAQERGKLFPEYFYSFLQSYMLIFSSSPILSPDEKIIRLKNDIGNIFKFLGPAVYVEDEDEKGSSDESEKGECEGLVIITSLVTSCIRGLYDCSSKLHSLEILLELASHASDETILDRILPYIMYLASVDSNAIVKISAINTITKCLNLVRKVPRSDANIFPEYILPSLAPLATDPSISVRAAYARNIAPLAEIALRYLEQVLNDWYDNNTKQNKEGQTFNYEQELQALHEMVQQSVSALLTDTQSIVKQTLLHSGITRLCVFFGKQKTNDVLLSHVITFLNDKEDKELREAFYDCIVGLAAYSGFACVTVLTPLLLQGLTDTSELVIRKSINAMSDLTRIGLISKHALCDLVSECACYLVHPNLWVRQATAGFISAAANAMSFLDVQVKIMKHIKMYMKHQAMQVEKPELVLDCLATPIPRLVYDNIIQYQDIDSVFKLMHDNRNFRECVKSGKVPISDVNRESTQALKQLFRRLEANGLTEEMGEYLIKMENHLKKIHKLKSNAEARQNRQNEGKIELFSPNTTVKGHVMFLGETPKAEYLQNRTLHRTNTAVSMETNINSDWNYSSDVLNRQSDGTNSGGPPSRSTSSRPSSPPPDAHAQFASADPSTNISLHERSYIQFVKLGSYKSKNIADRRSSCYVELANLKGRQQDHYYEAMRNREFEEQARFFPSLPPPGWHLKGVLAAHLHEHRGAVTKLCTVPDTPYFGSCANDGTVRLWDCGKMEGRNIANRSKQLYKFPRQNTKVVGMTVCDAGQSFGAIGNDGTVQVLRIDNGSNKMTVVNTRQLNDREDGYATDVHCIDSGSQSVLVYSTLFGSVYGWDLRSGTTAWKLKNDIKNDITSFCIDPKHNWLCMGTITGNFITWDLRFRLPISTIEQDSAGVRIRKVICHPTEKSWIISSVQGNNEVSMWNLETSFRQRVLWGSTTPPLSKSTQGSPHSVCALLAGCIDKSPFLLAGGTDQRVRFWDLAGPSDSYLAIPAASDPPGVSLTYETRLIDGTQVIFENCNVRVKDKDEEGRTYRAGPDPPAVGHRDSVTDMVLCKASQCFLVSSSRDGVIKVWK
ncbi:unnamed protein product [Brassicogethes aeneus]|uniref:non-specific serine/threonine protein kinase n=1 Tax=Brassicogethes aeneus TaxID=1431903 RepID=A0A9P0B5D3_BRAAE|nr:unnamed protein product [Brassicogethes aeneus]